MPGRKDARKKAANTGGKSGNTGDAGLQKNGNLGRISTVTADESRPPKTSSWNPLWNFHIQERFSASTFPMLAVVLFLTAACGYAHYLHVSTLQESNTHFSHLSTLEREISFRTEMGLYYSYFKTIVEAPRFFGGVHEIMHDNVTEYPDTINTLKRFNLYPEVFVAALYRAYEAVMDSFKIPTKMCWQVNRGENMPSIESCEGLGEPSYFYISVVWLLHGLNMAVFFLYGTFLSGSLLGGLLGALCFFYNHGEATRVMWTPMLRESFAYPFIVLQSFIVTYLLRHPRPSNLHIFTVSTPIICSMLAWQFTQFNLLTQTLSVFAAYALGYVESRKFRLILIGQSLGFLVSYLLLFGNEMLLTSFSASCLLTCFVVLLLEPVIGLLNYRLPILLTEGVLLIGGTVSVKLCAARLLSVTDDAHVSDILRSKFTKFANFHTMLYTCAVEFDFMEKETPWRLLYTLLLPTALVATAVVTIYLLRDAYRQWFPPEPEKGAGDAAKVIKISALGVKPHGEIVYHLFQLAAYTVMAVLIMRLKLFWTPFVCLTAALVTSKRFFGWVGGWKLHYALVFALIAGMSVKGVANLKQQWGIVGEYSNWPMEQFVYYINQNLPDEAVFAGPMPTMATVKLCSKHPIVNHPHYEDAGLRARTKLVYSMFSRKPQEEVHENLLMLKVDYVLVEPSWCFGRSKQGCSMTDIWDMEDKVERSGPPVCEQLLNAARANQTLKHFRRVFHNEQFHLFKVLK